MSGMIVSNIEVAQRSAFERSFCGDQGGSARYEGRWQCGLQSSSLKMLTTLGFSGNRPILVGACRLVRSVPVIPESSWWVNSLSCHCGDCRPAHCTFGHMHSSYDVVVFCCLMVTFSNIVVSVFSIHVYNCLPKSRNLIHYQLRRTSACNISMGHVSSAL